MESGDGLVVRVKPWGGRMEAHQVAGVARLAAELGNGLLDLTARANLQIRGVRDHRAVLDGLGALGLLDRDAGAEARRTLMVAPFGDAQVDRVADLLSRALVAAAELSLPSKFGFAVDCGAVPVLRGAAADIRIERGAEGLLVRGDGSDTGAAVTEEDAAEAAVALARWFAASGGITGGRGRMAAHLSHGAEPPARFGAAAALRAGSAPPDDARLAGFAFGQVAAADFARLGALRLTPWRMVLVEDPARLSGISAALRPGDPLLRVDACTGAPGCPQARGATRDLAARLAPRLAPGRHLHVSGCTKGCAHPGAADTVLTACGGGRFDLVRGGRARDMPERRGLTPAEIDGLAL
ncbi:precorrin-3B synthase [Palleronia sediminis]|uniref:Precorrin-3B synthase n=2 Tax=Palleronia sediminis TaxID=2547833 RepID=A0A4R5ZY81_9RHOB|nr:precorrin-3B synthase [Palleronia sediminis]